MLRAGGDAVDAAIAANAALAVVAPHSCGLGGDAFWLIWDGSGLHGLNGSGRAGVAASVEAARAACGARAACSTAAARAAGATRAAGAALASLASAVHAGLPGRALFGARSSGGGGARARRHEAKGRGGEPEQGGRRREREAQSRFFHGPSLGSDAGGQMVE